MTRPASHQMTLPSGSLARRHYGISDIEVRRDGDDAIISTMLTGRGLREVRVPAECFDFVLDRLAKVRQLILGFEPGGDAA